MELFADTASFEEMHELAGAVSGFTTNPTLIRRAGISDYARFARLAADEFPLHDLSIEVLDDAPSRVIDQAKRIQAFGANVYVKVPVISSRGEQMADVIYALAEDGVRVNVTAVTTSTQARRAAEALGHRDGIISVFAGRIADTGRDPSYEVARARQHSGSKTRVLWASAREALNYYQAAVARAHVITMPPHLIRRYREMRSANLDALAQYTARQFFDEAAAAGFTLEEAVAA